MAGNNNIIDLSGLAKPVNTLIEKISDAVGGAYHPQQIRRIAKAEAEAQITKTKANIEADMLEQRALNRMTAEETMKQQNMESIARKSFDLISSSAKPENIDSDWMVKFLGEARNISNEEMQDIWSRILAGESNLPGSFSKRTINLLAMMDMKDAEFFTHLCNFNWQYRDGRVLIITDWYDDLYRKAGVRYGHLIHLASIGLIVISEGAQGYSLSGGKKLTSFTYFDEQFKIELPEGQDKIDIGKVFLTDSGHELTTICTGTKVEGLTEHVEEFWKGRGLKIRRLV